MLKSIAFLFSALLISAGTAHAQQFCLNLYSADLSDAQLVEAEKEAIKARFAAFPGAVPSTWQNCQVKVKDVQNATASRVRKGQYGMQESVSGIETVSIIRCDAQNAATKMNGYFKIVRFERISEPKSSQFSAHAGCNEFNDRYSHATVTYTSTEVQ